MKKKASLAKRTRQLTQRRKPFGQKKTNSKVERGKGKWEKKKGGRVESELYTKND